MAQMTPQVSELLEKALCLSTQERGLLIDRLIESLDDEPAEEGKEWKRLGPRRSSDGSMTSALDGQRPFRESKCSGDSLRVPDRE